MANSDEVVGHKTFFRNGRYEHEPLTRTDADAIIESARRAEQERAEKMPTEQDAIRAMWSAFERLRELGWKEAMYCPKDGTEFDAIEAGSTGIHSCVYHGEWPTGSYWIQADGDLWPSNPILFRVPRLRDGGSE
jgi:hypothetical protein